MSCKSMTYCCFFLLLAVTFLPVRAQNPNNMSIEITSPRPGQRFTNCSDIPLAANVTIETGEIFRVYFYVNDKPAGNDREAPFEDVLESAAQGIYEIKAKVRDTERNEVYSDSIQFFVDPIEDGDLILNGEFECGKENWTLNLNDEADATFFIEEDYGLSDGNAAYIDIVNPGTLNWHVMLVQDFPIKANHTYEVYLLAEVFNDKPIGIDFQSTTGDYKVHFFQTIDITDQIFYGPIVFDSIEDDPSCQFKLALSENKEPIFLDAVRVVDTGWEPNTTAVRHNTTGTPAGYKLEQNYPNPFNPSTNISFELSDPDEVTLDVFDITGKKVRTLFYQNKAVGRHTVQWSGRDFTGTPVAGGIYLCRMQTSRSAKIIRMLLLK